MPPKKRAKPTTSVTITPNVKSMGSSSQVQLEAWDTSECRSNASKALAKLPLEVICMILSYYKAIGIRSSVMNPSDDWKVPHESSDKFKHLGPTLSQTYLVRPDVLRALSQTCIAYRRIFLPFLWERLDACVTNRTGVTFQTFYKHVGEALQRKCEGLLGNEYLASFVRIANVSITRYKTDNILPVFTKCLQALPNLHTIHIIHAHSQMTTAIKTAFDDVTLPTVRTVIIPGYCHELLKRCPEVRTVRCTSENGSKLVSVMGHFCKKVEEVRGIECENSVNLMKRLVKAAPKLRTLELRAVPTNGVIDLMKNLGNLCTIDIGTAECERVDVRASCIQEIIGKVRPVLLASPSKEKKYLRVRHRDVNHSRLQIGSDFETYIDVGLE